MASSCNLKIFQNPRLWLLALVWTVTWAFSSTESAAPIPVSGEIGGNVTFPCPVDKQRTVNFFYLQRGNTFVNGYYSSKDLPEPTKPWENTIVDRSETAVHMYGLNISHSGDYQCHIQYSGPDKNIVTTGIHLSVTANYSKPMFTMTCKDENHDFSCLVTCASHGGYPETKMIFNGNLNRNTSSQTWTVVNSSIVPNPATMMFDSSSTAYFNCSYGALHFLSCSVGESTSDMFSVCTPNKQPDTPNNHYVIAATVAVCALVVATIIMVGLRLCCKYKERQAGPADSKAKGCAEEVTFLNEATGKEAS